MAADVGEGVAVLAGEPVLEVRVAIVIGLDQLGLAAAEAAKTARAVLQPRVQRPAVEPLVVLDADEEPFVAGDPLDLDRLGVFQHQRLDRQDVLVAGQCLADDAVMEMVRHGHHHEIPRRQRGQHLLEQVGEHLLRRLVQAGIGFESLAGKGLGETGRFGQGPQRRRVQGADANAADAAHPLQVINARAGSGRA